MSLKYQKPILLLVILSLLIPCAFAADEPVITFLPGEFILDVGDTAPIAVMMSADPAGLSGFNVTVSLAEPSIGEIMAVSYPKWADLPVNSSIPSDSLFVQGVDLRNSLGAGVTNILLCTLTVRGDIAGETNLTITTMKIDDDVGGRYVPETTDAIMVVKNPPSVFSIDIPLAPGWNMISIPVTNAELTVPLEVMDGVYVYEPLEQIYVKANISALEAGKGYWVSATSHCTLTASGNSLGNFVASLRPGWNMIGAVCNDTSIAASQTVPADSVQNNVYSYNPLIQSYVSTTTLNPCSGYWVSAIENCTLNVSTNISE
ncbi:hypothetical protein [Methanogenium cariaci]|jgi:hypothetical protein